MPLREGNSSLMPLHPHEPLSAADVTWRRLPDNPKVAVRAACNSDVVFWYSFGHTHIPCTEDYPAMLTAYIGFLLKRFGVFDENAASGVSASDPFVAAKFCSKHD
jgi:hypothetical protein